MGLAGLTGSRLRGNDKTEPYRGNENNPLDCFLLAPAIFLTVINLAGLTETVRLHASRYGATLNFLKFVRVAHSLTKIGGGIDGARTRDLLRDRQTL